MPSRLLTVISSLFLLVTPQMRAADAFRAGAGQVEITPPVGHRMAGYFDERLATGVHDPLWAKAIVLQHGKEKAALVFCDLVGVTLNVSSKARAKASEQTGIPVSNILIAATHSHTGPLFDDVRRKYFHERAVAQFGKDPHEAIYYPDFLAEKIVQAIVQANGKLASAQLQAGIVELEGISFNRRFHMKDGRVAFNPGQLNPNIVRPAGPVDTDLGVVLVRNHRAKPPFAGITVFALHADTVGGSEYSADFSYYLEQNLRRSFGSNFVSGFGAGTCGDINHINVSVKEPVKGLEVAERLGSALAKGVLEAEPKLARVRKPALAVKSETIAAPLQEITPEQLADAQSKTDKLGDSATAFMTKVQAVKVLDIAQRGSTWPMEVQVFRLDAQNAIVGLPCEIFVELGLAIKKDSPFRNTIVMSICNDRPSYVPTRKAFAEGSYEVTNARVKPEVGEMLVETAVKLLNALKL